MRHGFTTLTQSQKCRANNGNTLAHPLLRHIRRSFSWWYSKWVIMIDFLTQGRTIQGAYYAGNARKSHERGEETDSLCLFLQDNTPAHMSQVTMTTATECGFEILPHPHIFSWYGSFWLLSVPKTEIPSSWYTIKKQWRRHRGSKRVLGGPEKGLLFWRDKKAQTEMAKCIAFMGDYIEKYFPGSQKYKGPRTFWSIPRILSKYEESFTNFLIWQ